MGSITPYEIGEGSPLPRALSQAGSQPRRRSAASRRCATRSCTSRWSRCRRRRASTSIRRRPAGTGPDVRRQLAAIQATADVEALVLHDARAGVEEPRRSGLGRPGDLVDPALRSAGLGCPISRRRGRARSSFARSGSSPASSMSPSTIVASRAIRPGTCAISLGTGRASVASTSRTTRWRRWRRARRIRPWC